MKFRTIVLVTAIMITALIIMGFGAYMKYELLQPYGIAQDKSIVELPFLIMADDALRYEIQLAVDRVDDPTPPETDPTTVPATEPSTEPVTEPTQPSTEPPTEPVTEPTQPSTDPPTEPVTEPTQPATEPPTEPTQPPTEPTQPPAETKEPPTDSTDPSTTPHEHSFVLNGSVAATCTADGYEKYACACGEEYTNALAAHGHSYTEEVFSATCSSEGYTLFTCSVCGYSYQDNWTDVLDHNYDGKVVEPTPNGNGYTEYTCKDCGATYRDQYTQYIPPESEPTTPPESEPTLPPETTPPSDTYPGYDFTPGAVSDDWYQDALFVGDSRTLGLREYARSGNAEYFCGVGMTVFGIQSAKCEDLNFSKQTLESLLASRTYGKVFINLGINECGYATNSIISAYQDLIELIQRYQPNAKIILQGILTVSKGYSDASYFQPPHIRMLNERIQGLSDNVTIYYIDANPYFTDADGYLYRDITGDGCHFYGHYYGVWADWISYAVGNLGI